MSKTEVLVARFAGGILLAFGLVLATLGFWSIERQMAVRHALRADAAAILLTFGSIAAFCSVVGFRLLFNRPNRHGSLLSTRGWMALAFVFLIIGLTLAALGLGRGDYKSLLGSLGLGLLAVGSVFAARMASRKRAWSPVLPAGTSLLHVQGFVPAGFVCGLEIMNDNLTPMEFVVAVLQNCIGLNEAEAIRVMLEIHTKGGALWPLSSFDEAKRVAELVTVEAKLKNHPLVCRAVSSRRLQG